MATNEPIPLTRTPVKDARVAVYMGIVLLIPAILTLSTIEVPREMISLKEHPNPSPYGYTWSLSLFFIPMFALLWWFIRNRPKETPHGRKAFLITAAILISMGFILDIIFATSFFTFMNKGADLGIMVPVVGGSVPIEEFFFYVSGIMLALLLYVWGNVYWFSAYRVTDYEADIKNLDLRQIIHPHYSSLILGVVLVIMAAIYKYYFSDIPEGFPGYFTFLIFVGIMPSLLFFRSALYFINWRAFSLAFFIMLVISFFWEAGLAAPYQWWGYQPEQMMGIFIGGLTQLPIEAVLVWLAVTYASVIIYEIINVYFAFEGVRAKD